MKCAPFASGVRYAPEVFFIPEPDMNTDQQQPQPTCLSPHPTASLERLRVKALEEENQQLKCLIGEQALYIRELEQLLSR